MKAMLALAFTLLVYSTASYSSSDGVNNSVGNHMENDRDETKRLTIISDLERDAVLARQQQLMLIVLVTLPECPYCEYIKEHHLAPMVGSGELDNIALVRELNLSSVSFVDFNGTRIEPADFANRYATAFSPTVLFLSPTGEQLHEPIIGMASRDYYGFYLARAIKKSAVLMHSE